MGYLLKTLLCAVCLWAGWTHAEERLRLATTTSTENSGLLDVLHPPFERSSGIRIDVISVGTGKALRLGRNGDVDIVMVHAPEAERRFVREGFGEGRLPLMHNDFVLLGHASDPADVGAGADIRDALRRLADSGQPFVSRGDHSGTHQKEQMLWRMAGVTPTGGWYLSAGQGMGAVLQMANDKLAYTLSDRGTWLAYRDNLELVPVQQHDPSMYNPYHLILVNPKRHPHVNHDAARRYAAYARGRQGQEIIRDFRRFGEPLFRPDVIQ